uniref:Putative secreted protein n=1 Tax=Anopheles darlingi TaxID=43151 RepID=A0A2M4D2L3_ANODA
MLLLLTPVAFAYTVTLHFIVTTTPREWWSFHIPPKTSCQMTAASFHSGRITHTRTQQGCHTRLVMLADKLH